MFAVGAALCAALLSLSHGEYFRPYLGPVHPVAAIALLGALGALALSRLRPLGRPVSRGAGASLRGAARAPLVAGLFAAAAIAVDLTLRFPRDINVPLPESLLFYPAIAFVAETAFHVLPLWLLLTLLSALLRKPASGGAAMATCLLLAASIEPVFQVRAALSGGHAFAAIDLYVAIHVLAFNLVQLSEFRRFGLVSMVALRLAYYFLWHIAWGGLRLRWLF